MRRRACTRCPHPEYLHEDRLSPTGPCMVEGCAPAARAGWVRTPSCGAGWASKPNVMRCLKAPKPYNAHSAATP